MNASTQLKMLVSPLSASIRLRLDRCQASKLGVPLSHAKPSRLCRLVRPDRQQGQLTRPRSQLLASRRPSSRAFSMVA